MLLYKITNKNTGKIYYLSKETTAALDNGNLKMWLPKINTAGTVSYRIDKPYGGMVRIQRGNISVDTDLFAQEQEIPYLIDLEIRYIGREEATTSHPLFYATCYVTTVSPTKIEYTAKEQSITVNVLDDAPDFGTGSNIETDRVYPRAFGTVSFETPLRVGTVNQYQYHKAYINGTTPSIADGDYDVFDDGRQKEDCKAHTGTLLDEGDVFQSVLSVTRFTTIAEHGFIVGDTVTFSGTQLEEYGIGTETYTITAVDSTTVFWANNHKKVVGDYTPIAGGLIATKTGGNSISIDTLSIRENMPKGTLRLSGTGIGGDLISLFQWGVARINADSEYTGYSLDSSLASTASMPINYWVSEQLTVTELLSTASAFYGHLFYINPVTKIIHLVDIANTSTPTNLTELTTGVMPQYIDDIVYKYPPPVKNIIAKWKAYTAGTDEADNPFFSERTEQQSIDGLGFGNVVEVPIITKAIPTIKNALTVIGTYTQSPVAPVKLPLSLFDIVPGNRYTWLDKKLKKVMVTIVTTSIQYNLDQQTISIEGLIL